MLLAKMTRVLLQCLLIISVNCELPEINGLKLSLLEPVGVFLEWDTVDYEYLKIVKGYEINVWLIEESTTRNFKLLNGEQYPGLQRNDIALEPFSTDHTPKENVNKIINSNVYHNQARIYNVTFEKLYEIRVNTYNLVEKGPMTHPIRVKIVKSERDYDKSEKVVKPKPVYTVFSMRHMDSCGVSIISNTPSGDQFVHRSYI